MKNSFTDVWLSLWFDDKFEWKFKYKTWRTKLIWNTSEYVQRNAFCLPFLRRNNENIKYFMNIYCTESRGQSLDQTIWIIDLKPNSIPIRIVDCMNGIVCLRLTARMSDWVLISGHHWRAIGTCIANAFTAGIRSHKIASGSVVIAVGPSTGCAAALLIWWCSVWSHPINKCKYIRHQYYRQRQH